MKAKVVGNPDYGEVTVELSPGESFFSEGGAMSRMSSSLDLKGRMAGGIITSLIRKLVGGESLFLTEYTATRPGFVSLSPSVPGAVLHRAMNGGSIFLTAGSYLASSPGIEMKTRFGGFRAIFSGEGAFLLECSGQGDLFFNAYGGVIEKDVDGDLTVDTGHVVAWEPTLEYSIGGMGGLKATLFSGEGLVMKFHGRGRIWLQTRTMAGMASWITPYLRG